MVETRAAGQLKQIPPGKIDRNPENPRLIFRQAEMEKLLVSIDKHGIKVPLAVYRDGDRYRLIDGERRWRCALNLNLKTVPALIQEAPSALDNLLLMYNIHALREQWDYYTIASKLPRVIELFKDERGWEPNEIELSEATGLSRRQIRRCRLLLDLPDAFKDLLLKELELPKSQQRLSEDFFIEMERSLKTVTKRLPEYQERLDDVRDTLVKKFRQGTISAVTDFRQLSKIATAVDNLDVAPRIIRRSLDQIFDDDSEIGIRQAYQATVGFAYREQNAKRHAEALNEFVDNILKESSAADLDDDLVELLQRLRKQISKLLGART